MLLRDAIVKIFQTVQHSKTTYKKQMAKLKQLYEEDENDEFIETFFSILKYPLSVGESSSKVDNMLEFAAKFFVTIDENVEDNPCLNKIFEHLVKYHDVSSRDVRYRMCNFFATLLNSMGEDAVIEDDLYDRIANAMLERIQDSSPKVRVQAVLALQRLQDPEMDSCPIISVYIFHMSKDPSAIVREQIINVIAKNKKTLTAVLKRIHDVNASVRKAAYKFISRITVRSLTISQRESILKIGLGDSSSIVVDAVKKILLPSWLRHFNYDYIALMKGLDAENSLDMAILTLKNLLEKEKRPWQELMQQTDTDEVTRLIPIDKITSQKVLFWRCLVNFIKKITEEEAENILPELTPFCNYIEEYMNFMKAKRYEFWEEKTQEIVLFQLLEMIEFYDLSDESGKKCLQQLLLNALKTPTHSERVINLIVNYLEKLIPNIQTRIETLLEIINELRMPMQLSQVPTQKKSKELSDKDRHAIKMQLARLKVEQLEYQEEEYNAIQTKQYLVAQELKEKIKVIQDKITALIEETTVEEVPQQEIPEIQEKNDPETIAACLRIMIPVMKSCEFNELTPVFRTLMENLALVNINHPDKIIRRLALVFLGLCCMVDENLAKKHIFATFLVHFSLEQECPEICSETLKLIFDLLCIYGLETFEITFDNDESNDKTFRRNKTIRLYNNHDDSFSGTRLENTETRDSSKLMKFLIKLMDSDNVDCRRIATTGLVKLLANEIVLNTRILARIIIQLHNPILNNDIYLLKYIINFLNYFAREIPQSQELLRDCFFLTLKILDESDSEPQFHEDINQEQILDLILTLTQSDKQKSGFSSVHNELAEKIMTELSDEESEFDKEILIKTLPKLHLKLNDEKRREIKERLIEIEPNLQFTSTRLYQCIRRFKALLEDPNNLSAVTERQTESQNSSANRIEEASDQSEPEMMDIDN